MGLITKKDVIRNLPRLEGEESDYSDDQEYAGYEVQDGGLLDDEDVRRSRESE